MNYTKRLTASVLVAVAASLALTVCLALARSTDTKPETHEATLAVAARENPAPVPATTPIPIGATRLVFTSDRDGNTEIYSKMGDDGEEINLTNNPATDACPVISPDGTKIAFTSDRSGRSNIYVMNADGSNVQAVTHFSDENGSNTRAYDPAWSPDGTKLVYVAAHFNGESSGLVVVNANGSGEPAHISTTSEAADPAWSPDGTRIAFVGREGTHFPTEEGFPYYLYVINADGSGSTRIVKDTPIFSSFAYPPEASGPSWSPDGTRLAFVSDRDGNAEIYTVGASGGAVTRLTNDPAADTLPTWLAGGDRLVFTSTRGGGRDLFLMNLDGSAVTRITGKAGNNFDADWRSLTPTPPSTVSASRIAFLRANPTNPDDADI
jgi:Tol biopolymer transport system component